MLKLTKPEIINGEQFIDELADAGITISGYLVVDGNGLLNLDCDPKHQQKIEQLLAAHIPAFIEPTIEQKLAKAGLSLDELKTALGL